MSLAKKTYEKSATQEFLGNQGATSGIANKFFSTRKINAQNTTANAFTKKNYRYLGIMKGDEEVTNTLENFMESTGLSKLNLGVQTIGESVQLSFTVKNLTPWGRARAYKKEAPEVSYSSYPGTRLITIALSTAISTGNTFAFTFNTTNIDTGVTTSNTVVSVAYASSAADTYNSIISAIEANAGIKASATGVTSDTITITAEDNCYITVVSAPAITGGTPPTVTTTQTDTSIIETAVAYENGTVDYMSVPVDDADVGLEKYMWIECSSAGDDEGKDYAMVDYVDTDENIIYLLIPFAQLPNDDAVIKRVKEEDYDRVARQKQVVEQILLEFNVHSDESKEMLFFPVAQLVNTTLPKKTADGEETTLTYEILPKKIGSDFKYFLTKKINK